MTIQRILNKKLKTFLRESFTGSIVSNNLKPGMIKHAMKGNVKIKMFNITTELSLEKVLEYSEQYFFERNWFRQSEKVVDIKHQGEEMSFERDKEKLWLVVLPFKNFFQVIIVKFEDNSTMVSSRGLSPEDFKEHYLFPSV